MSYIGTKPANQITDSTLIADGTVTPADLSTGKPVWDTNGNVGIGTSSPMGRLGVNNPGTGQVGFNTGTVSSPVRGNLWYDTDGTGWQFQIGKSQSSVFTPQMTFTDAGNVGIGTTAGSGVRLEVSGGQSRFSNDVYLTRNDASGPFFGSLNSVPLRLGTGDTERMRIDSIGRVTTPFQPFFRAVGAGTGIGQYFSNVNVGDTIITNIGNHYSNTSRINTFTAPVAGVYYFSAGCLKYSSNTVQLAIQVNGTSIFTDYAEGGSGFQNCTLSGMVYLNANDSVRARALNGDWYDNGPGNSLYNWFMGCLIG